MWLHGRKYELLLFLNNALAFIDGMGNCQEFCFLKLEDFQFPRILINSCCKCSSSSLSVLPSLPNVSFYNI